MSKFLFNAMKQMANDKGLDVVAEFVGDLSESLQWVCDNGSDKERLMADGLHSRLIKAITKLDEQRAVSNTQWTIGIKQLPDGWRQLFINNGEWTGEMKIKCDGSNDGNDGSNIAIRNHFAERFNVPLANVYFCS